MLPEVRENFSNPSKLPCGLPITELLVCAGFFLIYLAEEVVHSFLSHSTPEFFGSSSSQSQQSSSSIIKVDNNLHVNTITKNKDSPEVSSSVKKEKHVKSLTWNPKANPISLLAQSKEEEANESNVFVVCSDKQELIPPPKKNSSSRMTYSPSSSPSLTPCFKKNKKIINCCTKLPAYGSIVVLDNHEATASSSSVTLDQKVTSSCMREEESDPLLVASCSGISCNRSSTTRQGSVLVCCTDEECGNDDCKEDDCHEEECDDRHTFTETNATSIMSETEANLSVFRCIMIVFALSFHSIFDGLAIGLQNSTSAVIQLMIAISMHKLLIALVVGLEIFSATKSVSRVFLYMLPFSLMSPLGLIVAAVTKVNLSDTVTGILSGLSTGSLLYITFFEILLREKTKSKLSGLIQFLAVLLGFILMSVLQTLTEHWQSVSPPFQHSW